MFLKKKTSSEPEILGNRHVDFSYISDDDVYMDSACQSLRPKPVIEAINDYYLKNNACGGRVKYKWGQIVDAQIEKTRSRLLNYLSLSEKSYVCAFTLNTTYGLNLILNQIPKGKYDKIITSEIEHNSVFLSTMEASKRLELPRIILGRKKDGSLDYADEDLSNSIVVVNSASNIDGRLLRNLKELARDVRRKNGVLIIDAAQMTAHYHELLKGQDVDAVCMSAHKMYGASLGMIAIKKDFLKSLDHTIVGGGMVSAVRENDYCLVPDDLASWLEPGLQSYGEIIALGSAVDWLEKQDVTGKIEHLSKKLFDGLKGLKNLKLLNSDPSSVISFYSPKIDSHRLAIFLSGAGIMCRSGYFCCHYYLIETLKMPPLVRLSIGLHNTDKDIEKVIESIKKFIGE